MSKNIILIGMPLSGKTTTGEYLSKVLNKYFFDTDKYIEEIENMSIKEIFRIKGEKYFRKLEKKSIDEVEKINNTIIAVGGGLPAFFDNMHRLDASGVTVFIDVPMERLIERAKKNIDRPLLTKDIEKQIEMLYNTRLEYYLRAKVVIKYENEDVHTLSEKIIHNINCI